MGRSVVLTGSAGVLGRALRARFEGLGDTVVGVDIPGSGAEHEVDLEHTFRHLPCDVFIANAKLAGWTAHNEMAKAARVAIVNVGSIYGVLGNDPSMYEGTEVEPTPAYYSAAKGALVAITRWQATNLAPTRSNCVCPGGIFRGHSDLFRERYEARVPLRRMATEEDVVEAVAFLASPLASYITGQVLMVDGGLSVMA